MKTILHGIGYFFWIVKEIIIAGFSTAFAALRPNSGIDPIIIYYPLRIDGDWELFWFSTSITATPSTLSFGFRENVGDKPRVMLVQAAFGRVDDAERLHQVTTVPMAHANTEGSRQWFTATVPLERTGAFGYTVRVLPRSDHMADPAELGVVVNA